MVIAVAFVRVMQVAVNDVIDVIAVRHGFMAAAVTVQMARFVARALVRRAAFGILGAHFEAMLVVMALVRMVQMAVVQVIDVAVVLNRGVTTTRAMRVVGMIVLDVFGCHNASQCK